MSAQYSLNGSCEGNIVDQLVIYLIGNIEKEGMRESDKHVCVYAWGIISEWNMG
jgi:hypothetical protein